MIDIVELIDEVTAPVCGWCSKPLSPVGASLYFCDIDPSRSSEQQCQYRWHAERSNRLVGYREAGHDFIVDAVRTPGTRTEAAPDLLREWREFGRVLESPLPRATFTPPAEWVGRSPAEILSGITIDLRPFVEAVERARAQLARAVAVPLPILLGPFVYDEASTQVAPQVVVDEPYRAEQMRAALEARRNRNTGPRQQPRAPRRIDARRSR